MKNTDKPKQEEQDGYINITQQLSRPTTAQEARQLLKLLSSGNKAAHKFVKSMSDESVLACAQRRYDDLSKQK